MRRFFVLIFLTCFGFSVSANQADYPPISPENVNELQEVELLGTGMINNAVAWADDGKIVVGGTRGLYIYDDLQAQPEFIKLDVNVIWLLFAGETLFFSDDTMLYAYNLATQQILYSLEGQKPLAISETGTMLAYEVEMGIEILEIATGEQIYYLDYTDEFTNDYDWSNKAFITVQFFGEDTRLYASWLHYYGSGWEGLGNSGEEIWTLPELSRQSLADTFGELPHGSYFLGIDANDEPILRGELEGLRDNDFVENDQFEPEYLLHGDYLAAAYYYRSEEMPNRELYTGIWNWRTGDLIINLPYTGKMSFKPDATMIAIDNHIFELSSGEELVTTYSTTYDLYGENILRYSADGSIRLLDGESFEEIAVLPIQQPDVADLHNEVFTHKNETEAFWIDPETGAVRAHFADADAPLLSDTTLWSFDESERFAMSYDYIRQAATLWSVETGQMALPQGFSLLSQYFYEGSGVLVDTPDSIALYNPLDGSFFWTYPDCGDCGAQFGTIQFTDEYLLRYGNDAVYFYDMQTQELLLRTSNPYGGDDYFAWMGDKIAYLEANELVLMSFPTGQELWRVQTNVFGSLHFYDRQTLWLDDEFTHEYHFFDTATGEAVPDPRPVYRGWRFAQTAELSFFLQNSQLRIETADALILREFELAPLDKLVLSSDESRLLIDYRDGSIGIWAVEE